MKRILIPLWGEDVAPRLDLAPEVMIALLGDNHELLEQRVIILHQASVEALWELILRERIDVVVCCGLEDSLYQYLTWKKVTVLDSVAGTASNILARFRQGTIKSGDLLL